MPALATIATLILIWTAIWAHLHHEHARAIRHAEESTADFARLFEAVALRSIDAIDQVLLTTRGLYQRDAARSRLESWIQGAQVMNEISIQIAIADATGNVVASSLGLSGPAISIADREHFRVHANSQADYLFISKPVVGRVSNRTTVQLVRSIRDAAGQFQGVIVASVDPIVLARYLRSTDNRHGYAMLFGLDGTLRAAWPPHLFDAQAPPDPDLLSQARAAQSGTTQPKPADGTAWIASFRRIGRHPLVVAVAMPQREALAAHATEVWNYSAVGVGLSILVITLHCVRLRYRRRAERSQQALAVTLANISQGIVMIDHDGSVPVINPRAVALLGLPPALGRPGVAFADILRWQSDQGEFTTQKDADAAARIEREQPGGSETVYEWTRPDGTTLEVRTTHLPDGSVVRTLTDITERIRFARELALARDSAEAGARARAEFLRIMSHEMRTPLNGILGMSDLLRALSLDEEVRRYVTIIRRSGGDLLAMVDDILDFSSLDTGRLALEQAVFELPALILDLAEIRREEATERGLTLVVDIDPSVPRYAEGDARRLRQILANLLGNAVKFTPAGGVTVTARANPEGPAHVRLAVSVRDSGIGMSAEQRAVLFQPFTQLDASLSRRFGGTGLGLAICDRLVRLMDGTIGVESAPGQGSTFRFEVRLGVAAAIPVAEEAEADGRTLRILIAEDNPTNRLVATKMVAHLGHHADAVVDGAEAVATLRRDAYDLVLMDVMMPGMDGLEATRTIRADAGAIARTPVIGLTANARPDDQAACIAAGMDAFLTKPVSVDSLAATIRAVVRRRAG